MEAAPATESYHLSPPDPHLGQLISGGAAAGGDDGGERQPAFL